MKSYNKKPISVSFFGMPAVGKTTITNILYDEIKKENRTIVNWGDVINKDFLNHNAVKRNLFPLLYVFKSKKSMKSFIKIVFNFFKLQPLSFKDNKRYYSGIIKVWLIKNFLVSRNKADVYLFEEATINALSHIDNKKIKDADIDIIDYFLPHKSFIFLFFVNASVSTLMKRNILRPHKGFPGENKEKKFSREEKINILEKMYENQVKNKKNVFHRVIQNDLFSTKTINSMKLPQENVEIILTHIKKKIDQ